jgi:hypothetical protein
VEPSIRSTAGIVLLLCVVRASGSVAQPFGDREIAAAPPAVAGREPCALSSETVILTSPRALEPGGPLRVIAASERARDAALVVVGPDGEQLAHSPERHGGPPYWWYAEATLRRPGRHRIGLGSGADVAACQDVVVGASPPERPSITGAWPVTRDWSRATENLYSAWIEKLFDDPLTEQPSWRALHEVTRDPGRNFLHDHLGLGEDSGPGLRLVPDCADLPYFLRAYFAWKLGLPFGYSECSRGDSGRPPRCDRWHSNAEPLPAPGGDTPMQRFLDHVADVIQSGAARAPAEEDRTDLYPTRLSPETLRPGTVYADPYGHTLVVVRRMPQSPSAGGLLLAVDAQPDMTVGRKRYWRGNFLFAVDPALGGAGFKHFRPVVREGAGLRALTNREIAARPDYGDYSLEQYEDGVEGFYDRVDAVLSPEPLDPARAFRETIDALDEQVHARIRSVANGEAYTASHRGSIPMPDGPAVFETIGPWEDFATPARDLRLLIAIDVVHDFPDRVLRRPQRFEIAAGVSPDALRGELGALLGTESRRRSFEYTRSDGSTWTLSLADVLARAEAFEMAYNPNDCVELRWGASAASEELSTCKRHRPGEQEARMERYRPWFHERRRPPR